MPLEPKRSTFQDKAQALRRALGASGYDPRDFDIEADRTSPLAALFQLTGGLVVVPAVPPARNVRMPRTPSRPGSNP